MDATLNLLNLAGAIALLLWGVQYGAERRAARLRARAQALSRQHPRQPDQGGVAGLGVTTVLQSSTATGLMVASFAGAGFVALVPALAVMLDANVGTTLIVQALSFDVSRAVAAAPAGGGGDVPAGGTRTRDIGRVAIGLGLMLIALLEASRDHHALRGCSELADSMGAIATDRCISVAFGALLAWAAHSSVAVSLLVMSFAEKGVVPLNAALALIVGANIGTAS